MRRIIIIEFNQKAVEVGLVLFLHFFDQFLRFYAGGLCTYHNGRAVSIVGAEIETLVSAHLLEADPDVGLNIFNEMADMDWAVGIRQGTCYYDFSRHNISLLPGFSVILGLVISFRLFILSFDEGIFFEIFFRFVVSVSSAAASSAASSPCCSAALR